MWAYRVSASTALASTTVSTTSTSAAASAPTAAGVDVDQDYGDDGEDGAGVRLAGLLASMKVVGVLVVVSRWFGGVKLGSERWRCISGVGREAIVKGSEEGRWIVGLI